MAIKIEMNDDGVDGNYDPLVALWEQPWSKDRVSTKVFPWYGECTVD